MLFAPEAAVLFDWQSQRAAGLMCPVNVPPAGNPCTPGCPCPIPQFGPCPADTSTCEPLLHPVRQLIVSGGHHSVSIDL